MSFTLAALGGNGHVGVESAERELATVVLHYRGHLHHALAALNDKLLRSKLPALPEALEAILAACYEVDRRTS